MRTSIHPHYRTVVFHDIRANHYLKIGSTIQTQREITLEGVAYPYVTIDISSKSHSFYTGKQKAMNSDGRLARFSQRFGCFFSSDKVN